ncbi:nucleoside phosphatase family-domain-containing protein [Mycena maculata]|uniref:guanosine-diphosphatase n=1 Tax=Mycena maculata TaxID=230809 RepID=A0AAD7N4I8_9AGAR|nr:nucleoside phosphatase family-domain-containing protein [Mycena maculata]
MVAPKEITPPSPSSSSFPPSATSTLSPRSATPRRMAPPSPTYDRLEAGPRTPSSPAFPPPRGKQKYFGWRKFLLGAGVLLVLVWLFVPKEKRRIPGWGGGGETWEKDTVTLDTPPMRPGNTETDTHHADEDIAHPTSFETDPDPAKTTHCTAPHSPSAPLVQYALMLDAGSTGSRIHVYKFNNCGPSPAFEYETFKMTQPGLSSFAGRAQDAAASLDVLLAEALRVVPAALARCAPVAVKATAGLRLLPGSQAADILAAVRARLRGAYPFALPADDDAAAAVMDGADEGVFAWVTANYLLGLVTPESGPAGASVAVLDLGGASTQIVFAPVEGAPLREGDHKYELEFGRGKRVLYQHSYLGYGLMRARASVHRVVDFMGALHDGPDVGVKAGEAGKRVSNACLARGTRRAVELAEAGGGARTVVMDGGDVGSFAACARIVALVLAKDAVCAVRPCAFGGVYQPALAEAFPAAAGRVLLLSYFYDRVAPLVPGREGGGGGGGGGAGADTLSATVDTIKELGEAVCRGREAWLERWGARADVMAELEGRPEWCLDLTFMHGLLRTGYEFDGEREVMFGKKIAGTELGWCLGAGIKLVGGVDVQCRV